MKRLALVIGVVIVTLAAAPVSAGSSGVRAAAAEPGAEVNADLEGKPIPTSQIPKYRCNDFDFPAIHCFRSEDGLQAAVRTELSIATASGVDYVQVFDGANFVGASMVMSQDYNALWTIGWNDRIGSFKGRNSQSGTFYTDWFGTGSAYGFCCNQWVSSLGGYDNTFSSVYNN